MWLLYSESLLTNIERNKRGMTNVMECGSCMGKPEDGLHVVRECKKVVEVWRIIIAVNDWYPFHKHTELKAWVDWNIKANIEYNGMPWNVVFPLVCHQLWLARNQKVFNGVNVSAQSIIAKVLASANWG